MFSAPKRPEIDHRTMKLIVGVVAVSLAGLTSFFAKAPLASISASYYEEGWSQSIFIGCLVAIAAFLLAYNGRSPSEMVLSKIASVAGLCVALFPCACDGHVVLVPYIHNIAAAIMFLVLTDFCYEFYRRAKRKGHTEAERRAVLYAACGVAIVLSIAVLAYNGLARGALQAQVPRLTFYGEAIGLIAFGISWLVASKVLPVLASAGERFSPLRDDNPDDSGKQELLEVQPML